MTDNEQQLQAERDLALAIIKNPGRIQWGWNHYLKQMGYWLDNKWFDTTILGVIQQAAVNEAIPSSC